MTLFPLHPLVGGLLVLAASFLVTWVVAWLWGRIVSAETRIALHVSEVLTPSALVDRRLARQLDTHYPEPRRLTAADVVALRLRLRARREFVRRFGAEGADAAEKIMRRIAADALPPDELADIRALVLRMTTDPKAARDHGYQLADALARLLAAHDAVTGRQILSPEPTRPAA